MTFNYVHIENFKAIKDMRLDYHAGVWEVIGINNDGPYLSNGSAKTTMLEAVQQCLFNRTTLQVPIEDVGRKKVGSSGSALGFKLTTAFEKDGNLYKVVNDRSRMKITIYENGEDLGIKSIPLALKRIQLIVGMDINTFITLTFITHSTIGDLLENFSSSSLMKIILDFNQITDLDKLMKSRVKELTTEISALTFKVKTLEDSIEVLSKYKKIDTTSMHLSKASIIGKITLKADQLSSLKEVRSIQASGRASLEALYTRKKDLGSGVCDTCGHVLEGSALTDTLDAEIYALKEEVEHYDPAIHELLADSEKSLADLQRQLREVGARIVAADTTNQIYEDNVAKSEDLHRLMQEAEAEKGRKMVDHDVLTLSVGLIKKGDLHRHLLASFVSVLNKYLDQFRSFVNLPYVAISAEANKANVSFVIHDTRFNKDIHLHTLSGGEKTRLRLILLLAMLYTIKDMTNASSNLLIFDESLDTLDASASEDLARLFDYLVAHDSKFIALISHGQQLKDINFAGRLTVTKSAGVSTLERDTYE